MDELEDNKIETFQGGKEIIILIIIITIIL